MARGTGTHTAHTPMHSPMGEPSHPSLTKIIQARAEEESYIWEPQVVGLPRNGKHSLCMYSHLALGSHATVTLNESSHFLALISRLSALHSPLSHLPPHSPQCSTQREWEREIKQSTYFFCTPSTPTTSPLPLVTLSLYFEIFSPPLRGWNSVPLPPPTPPPGLVVG